ncbi:hypothetical protein HDU79_002419 [Rhizoclosmatium sp. JEL0117]|nr:hypothetical protein HDU79_002419 [Rhizoclosmatium sp. JEL0117]
MEDSAKFARIDSFLDLAIEDDEIGVAHPFDGMTDWDQDDVWHDGLHETSNIDAPIDVDLLESVNFNISRIAISETRPDKGKGKAVAVAEADTPTTLCRHLLAGGCYRSDCWFSHDLSTTVCKFHLSGFCRKGDECPFLHEREEIEAVWEQQQELHYEDETNETYDPYPSSFEELEKTFPTLTDETMEKGEKLNFWGPTISYNEALKREAAIDNSEYRFNIGVAKTVPSGTANHYLEEGKKMKVDMGWLSTGGAVEALYSKQRKEAAEVAVQRNKLFQRAADAFRSGNTAAAKTFSIEARKLDELMQKLHAEASATIFQKRNQQFQSAEDERVIDLHGLHGNEGIYYLQTALDGLKRDKFHGTVTVITGTGHHSRGSLAKVGPQIREHFRTNQIRFKEATLEDGKGGMFIIKI